MPLPLPERTLHSYINCGCSSVEPRAAAAFITATSFESLSIGWSVTSRAEPTSCSTSTSSNMKTAGLTAPGTPTPRPNDPVEHDVTHPCRLRLTVRRVALLRFGHFSSGSAARRAVSLRLTGNAPTHFSDGYVASRQAPILSFEAQLAPSRPVQTRQKQENIVVSAGQPDCRG